MKKITIKYPIEIPEEKLDRYCQIMRIGRNTAISQIKDLAEVYGRTAVYKRINKTITKQGV